MNQSENIIEKKSLSAKLRKCATKAKAKAKDEGGKAIPFAVAFLSAAADFEL